MPARGPANDEERLPWLEPYRDVIAQKQRVARRSHGGLVAVAAGLLLLFVAGGGYWLGRSENPRIPQPATIEVASEPEPMVPAPMIYLVGAAPENATAPEAVVAEPAPPRPVVRKAVPRKSKARQRKIRSAGIESEQLKAVRAAQERAPPPPPRPVARRAWPKMPSPGPAGQVIQLGAFTNPARANAAYRQRLARYPLLGRMPRVVVPVVTRPRGRILYVLRLGTTSRQQSATVCRNLRASGDHCLVIG